MQLTGIVSTLPESTEVAAGLTVGTIGIIDDAIGNNQLLLSGPDAASFVIVGNKLQIKVPKLDFESKTRYDVTVAIDDPDVGATPDASVTYTLNVTNVNDVPSVTLQNVISTLPEGTDVSSGRDVASIVVVDDALGTNVVSLSGPDVSSFAIVAGKLRFNASQLDFETKPTYQVTVSVSDVTISGTNGSSVQYVLQVSDVNEPPTAIRLINPRTTLDENSDASVAISIGNIVVDDDLLGGNVVTISGRDAAFFSISAGQLNFKTTNKIDFESKPSYVISLSAVDPTIPGSLPVLTGYTLHIQNVPEVVSLTQPDGRPLDGSTTVARVHWDSLVTVFDGAMTFTKTDIGSATVPVSLSQSDISGTTVTDIRFSGTYVDALGLVDGIYRLNIDGTKVRDRSDGLTGVGFDSVYTLTRPTPTTLLKITGPEKVAIGSLNSYRFDLTGSNVSNDSVITYRVDINGDGVVDRILTGGPSIVFDAITYPTGGDYNLQVDAQVGGVTISTNTNAIDVVPNLTNGARWSSAFDVNLDDSISPLDVLVVINWVNSHASGYSIQLDVDRDGDINPLDILTLVNYINSRVIVDTYSPFQSIQMNDTGVSDGVSSNLGVHGRLIDATNKLFLSLDGGVKHEVLSTIQSDGTFDVTDQAIREMFVQSPTAIMWFRSLPERTTIFPSHSIAM